MRWTVAVAALVLSACGSGSGGIADAGVVVPDAGADAGIPDAGGPVDAGACALRTPIEGKEITEGGRLTLALAFDAAPAEWSVQAAGTLSAAKLDATHLQLKSAYGNLSASTVKLAIDCSGRSGTAEFEIKTRRPSWSVVSQWTEGADGPNNREYGVSWIDSGDANRLLVYGGFHYKPSQFTGSSDLWELNLSTSTWKELTPANASPKFMGGRVAPIPGKRELIFVGGVTAAFDADYHLDRFEYAPDKLTWRPMAATPTPAFGDYQPGFVFDSKRGRYLTFCGQSADFHCRVRRLELNLTTGAGSWTDEPVTGPVPPGRSGHFFAYDEETDRVIVFGGMQPPNNMLGDTWALELGESPARWVKLADNPELKRRNGAFALDAENHRLIVWGGTPDGANAVPGIHAISLDRGAENWKLLEVTGTAPPARASGMAVADPTRRRILMGFGNSTAGNYPDLWSLNL
jgi:hypothetical protein